MSRDPFITRHALEHAADADAAADVRRRGRRTARCSRPLDGRAAGVRACRGRAAHRTGIRGNLTDLLDDDRLLADSTGPQKQLAQEVYGRFGRRRLLLCVSIVVRECAGRALAPVTIDALP